MGRLAMLFITHDFGVSSPDAHRVAAHTYAGRIVESGADAPCSSRRRGIPIPEALTAPVPRRAASSACPRSRDSRPR